MLPCPTFPYPKSYSLCWIIFKATKSAYKRLFRCAAAATPPCTLPSPIQSPRLGLDPLAEANGRKASRERFGARSDWDGCLRLTRTPADICKSQLWSLARGRMSCDRRIH